MTKLLWEEMFSDSLKYQFLALKPVNEGLKEEEDTVGEYDIGEVIGEGQFATVKSCFSRKERRTLAGERGRGGGEGDGEERSDEEIRLVKLHTMPSPYLTILRLSARQ